MPWLTKPPWPLWPPRTTQPNWPPRPPDYPNHPTAPTVLTTPTTPDYPDHPDQLQIVFLTCWKGSRGPNFTTCVLALKTRVLEEHFNREVSELWSSSPNQAPRKVSRPLGHQNTVCAPSMEIWISSYTLVCWIPGILQWDVCTIHYSL